MNFDEAKAVSGNNPDQFCFFERKRLLIVFAFDTAYEEKAAASMLGGLRGMATRAAKDLLVKVELISDTM
jgi:hypothetical protein